MKITQNREISWLQFNKRVLEEAADSRVPLLERAKFLSIFTSNLDEFYMIRCGSLYDLSLIDNTKIDKKSGMIPSEQLDAIFAESNNLYKIRDNVYKDINHTLNALHLSCVSYKTLSKGQEKFVKDYFDTDIAPLLSPQIIDSHHPFPHLVNKAQYLFLEINEDGNKHFALIPVPDFANRIVYIPNYGHCYMLIEQIMFHCIERLFKNCKVLNKTIVRIARNADINLNEDQIDDDDDYREYMKHILKKRNRLAPIRLEIYKEIHSDSLEYLCSRLSLRKEQVFISKCPLELSHIFKMIDLAPTIDKTPLLYKTFTPQSNPLLTPELPCIPQIMDHDVLLFYLYQSMDGFLKLLKEASEDKHVVSIKITIYRLAKHSKIVRYLCRAAENGKNVTVLMELKARFDEQNNISAAEELEESGCHILYDFENYKVHSKICLITYKDKNEFKYITQIGTGNYNEKTSKMYTDHSYITSRKEIGKDAVTFFQNMSMSNLEGQYQHLWVAPSNLKSSILKEIDNQINLAKQHQPARIRIKMNSFTDLDIIHKISEASMAGVKIEMIIRGICCLLPGLENATENITIRSIVGRYLEHSRIYCFGDEKDIKIYIASADCMTRNTEKRVEIGCPIQDEKLKNQILEYFTLLMSDNIKARELCSDGHYKQIISQEAPLNSQEECMHLAIQITQEIKKSEKGLIQHIIKSLRKGAYAP
jgi:polyphosphate kinase